MEHTPGARALAVRELLGDLWGDALPATEDPWLRLCGDGLAGDDAIGRQEGVVVRGDALTLAVLGRLVRGDLSPAQALTLLPEGLRLRLERTQRQGT